MLQFINYNPRGKNILFVEVICMEVLTVGQILSSVPGKFYGDESVRGIVVSEITHNINELKKDSIYVIRRDQAEDIGQFIKDNMDTIISKGTALVVAPMRVNGGKFIVKALEFTSLFMTTENLKSSIAV